MVAAMTGLAPIRDKLAILIPRLASDKAGEVAATAAAITRQLSKAGADWHDLADTLTSASETPAQNNEVLVFTNYAEAVEWILATDNGELTATQIRFVESMSEILERWPPKPKQAEWLRSLVAKLGGRFDG